MTVIVENRAEVLPEGAIAVESDGLLARVERPCPQHRGECPCVARHEDARCLVFWCERGDHHFMR